MNERIFSYSMFNISLNSFSNILFFEVFYLYIWQCRFSVCDCVRRRHPPAYVKEGMLYTPCNFSLVILPSNCRYYTDSSADQWPEHSGIAASGQCSSESILRNVNCNTTNNTSKSWYMTVRQYSSMSHALYLEEDDIPRYFLYYHAYWQDFSNHLAVNSLNRVFFEKVC